MAEPPRPLPLHLPTLGGKQLWADVFVHRGFRIQRHALTQAHRLLGPRNARLTGGTFEQCLARFDQLRAEQDLSRKGEHLVLLLHGIFRAKEGFAPMLRALQEEGYEAEAINYPSTQATIESHADQLEELLARVRGVRQVSFVTHSMGGLVARELLTRTGAPWRDRLEVHRLVQIATPNQGAHMADRLLPLWAFRRLAGPAAAQLATDYVPDLGVPDIPIGIIAGARGDDRGWNPLLPGDDDVTVSLQSTHLPGAEDTLVVKAIHTFIMQHPQVIASTLRYLRTGQFLPPTRSAGPGSRLVVPDPKLVEPGE